MAAQIPGILLAKNPHAKHIDVTRKGYVLVDLTAERMQAEFHYVKHKVPNDIAEEITVFTVARDSATLVPGATPSPSRSTPPAPAP